MHDAAEITVIKPGWFSTIQDLGRYGLQRFGMPVSGAMDRRSLVLGNRLVGNADKEAGLEFTINGPELLFNHDTIIAITGADLSPSLNGLAAPLWRSLSVTAGSSLTFGARRTGTRSYLAVAGGIDTPMIFGSRSTHVASKTGGIKGRALLAGDVIPWRKDAENTHHHTDRSLPEPLQPIYTRWQAIRIIPGPHVEAFPNEALGILTSDDYRLSSQSDRMGFRLQGPPIPIKTRQSHISDGTTMGAIQIPRDGHPILLMADRQTTGGYPILATVISADLSLVGQLGPGESIRFSTTTLDDAQNATKTYWNTIDELLPPSNPTHTTFTETNKP